MSLSNGNNHRRLLSQGYEFLGNFDSSDLRERFLELLETYNHVIIGSAYTGPESHDVIKGQTAIFVKKDSVFKMQEYSIS